MVALASAVRPFKNPGADTVRQTPGFCVMYPAIAAALPAFCSCRKPMNRIPSACASLAKSVIGIPTRPKIVSMSLHFNASMTRWKPSVSSGFSIAVRSGC